MPETTDTPKARLYSRPMTEREVISFKSVENWAEACWWVEHAVKREAERLMKEGEFVPESFLKAETLRAAWKRIQRG